MKVTLADAILLKHKKMTGTITPEEEQSAQIGIDEIEAMENKDRLPDEISEIFFNLLLVCNDLDEAFAMHKVSIEFACYEDCIVLDDESITP